MDSIDLLLIAARRHAITPHCDSSGAERQAGVDLLELGLAVLFLIVLVRGIGGPVARWSEDFADNETVCLERGRSAEVVDLARTIARATQFDRGFRSGHQPSGIRRVRRGGRNC